MIDVASLGHIAIKVKDVARSMEFYVDQLGFKEMLRLNYSDGSLFLIYLRITDMQYFELFPNGAGDRAPDRDVVALNHFCLTVDDIELTVRQLVSSGVPIARELKNGVDGNRQTWIEDPDGNRIEIMEMAATCMQYAAVAGLHRGAAPMVRTTEAPPPLVAVG